MIAPGHWAKFTDAIRDCQEGVLPRAQRCHEQIAQILLSAQRFYLPDSTNLLSGRRFDESLVPLLRLPYETVAVLSETDIIDQPTPSAQSRSWRIALAIDPHGSVNQRHLLFPTDAPDGSIGLVSLTLFQRRWTLFPFLHYWAPRPGGGFLSWTQQKSWWGTAADYRSRAARSIEEEYSDDIVSITNLCVLLNLHNTRTEQISPPEPLQRSRKIRRKKPLYDYHILVVDGERWDSPHITEDTGNGVRSHLRRGHIRRIAADRHTWVRATYVHGSVPGFVDKDYEVKK